MVLSEPTWLFGVLVSLSSFKLVVLAAIRGKKPRHARGVGRVSGIVLYPVKSCRGLQLTEVGITQSGLVDTTTGLHDRHFMVVDDSGNFISQRKEPRMSLVEPCVEGGVLRLRAPGQTDLTVPLTGPPDTAGGLLHCRVWGDPVAGLDCGEEAASWFTAYLERPARLVYANPSLNTTKRYLHQNFSHLARPYDKVAYQDWGQVLAISDASLDDLNSRLDRPVTMTHFRPNFTVSSKQPYGEDDWYKLYIGDGGVQFTNVKLCGRCIMTTVDPHTGMKSKDQQPLLTLKSYRMKPGKTDPCFGINVFCDVEGTIKVGDSVEVTTKDIALQMIHDVITR